MSFLPLVRIWVLASVLASAAGWLLSALGQLNRAGYAVLGAVTLGGVWLGVKLSPKSKAQSPKPEAKRPDMAEDGPVPRSVGRKALGGVGCNGEFLTCQGYASASVFNWRKLRARFRRWLPASFAGLAFLVFLGATLYPPTTHEGLSCRVPRVLHWLAEGHWHWIHTPNARLNDRPCGLEWLAAPLLLFTRSDRGLFLINFIPLLLLPGLIFSVFTRLGVRARVAWHWMWLLPTGYNFLLQSGSLGNDTTPAFYALAAVDFGLRAWASRRPADLCLSILSAAFLSATKVSDLPLLLPWAVVVFPSLALLIRRPAATLATVMLAASASLLPTAVLNIHYGGDWAGLAVEHSVIEMKHPLIGIWGNALLLLKNFAPPVFPLAGWWNQSALTILPHTLVAPMVANFEPGFHSVGELPTEDWAGLGFGVSMLVLISVVAAWIAGMARARAGAQPLGCSGAGFVRANRPTPGLGRAGVVLQPKGCAPVPALPAAWRRLTLVAPWISLLAYFMKAAMMDLPRHLSAYYPLLLPLLLGGVGRGVIVRRRWWRMLACGVVLLAVPVVVLVPGRPLWPAQTVLSKLTAWKPNQRALQRALTVYTVYGARSDPLANVRALLPQDLKVVGFLGTADDLDISLWRPFGSRKVEHILLDESPAQIRQRHILYAVVGEVHLAENHTTLAEWQRRTGAELIAAPIGTTTVFQGPRHWYVVRFGTGLEAQP